MANNLLQMDNLNKVNLCDWYKKTEKYYQYLTVASLKRIRLEKNKKYTLQIKNNASESFGFYVCENCFQGNGNIKINIGTGETKKILITSVVSPWNWDNALIKSTQSQTVPADLEIILVRGDYTEKEIPSYILPIT